MDSLKIKTLISLIFVSLSGISQPTDFTEEENQYVKSVLIEIDNTEKITYEETIKRLEEELKKIPYHPDLVFPYLRMNDVTDRKHIASNYCQNELGTDYLSKNQDILKKCAECAVFNNDLKYAESIIDLLEELKAKHIIKASIALEKNDIDKFKTLGKGVMHEDFFTLNTMKYNVLNHLIAIYYAENSFEKIDLFLDKHLEMYLENPQKLYTGFDALVILHLRASERGDFKTSLKIIKMAEVMYEEDKMLLQLFKAKGLAGQGLEFSAEEAIIEGLIVTEEDINNRLTYIEISYFNIFYEALIKIENPKIQVKLVESLSQKGVYQSQCSLLMAYLYAGIDKAKLESYFDAYVSKINPPGIDFFEALLQLRHEKKKPKAEFSKIIEILNTIYTNTDEALFFLAKAKIELKEIARSDEQNLDLDKIKSESEEIKLKDTHHVSLNETLELVIIVTTYFKDKDKAQQLVSDCVYCENYDTKYLVEAMQDENDLLVVYFFDKLDAVNEYYEWFEEQFLKQLLQQNL